MASVLLSVVALLPSQRRTRHPCRNSTKIPVSRIEIARSGSSKGIGSILPAAVAATTTFLWANLDVAAAAASPDLVDPGVARLAINVLGPAMASFNVLFIARIVMSWYPRIPVDKLPYVIAFAPTEPVLAPTRKIIQPIGGVDMAPVAWFALLSLLNEVLLGQQGLLVVLAEQR
ncbi:protein COFACTOR ASSEMBLY OF COMPLEX C SUBUNIT B CCB3, chloroplastic-like [Selaginella moellendorffii]|uniref:protein COFACTOR ASSEMBLY OF COMPLEX C SUBUNIT B CCB3, chloroplastic-like n=1 Tax=Selaginella moellendorffii TaxID=88036 RepID=UPI000D1CD6B1|nr:protein COFACTOR ASSEMBLY OF COMPLEX C SUBUNIT B CCB3, chloroplastic-like [Selaginella moellendorffii]|eukprot:XP_024541522.1 protein COFACTOR ASSEMBLY OF COMPLEX C SUBUNIT B CCB3, chloroplastic-like [Selaginella moellendorffii]